MPVDVQRHVGAVFSEACRAPLTVAVHVDAPSGEPGCDAPNRVAVNSPVTVKLPPPANGLSQLAAPNARTATPSARVTRARFFLLSDTIMKRTIRHVR